MLNVYKIFAKEHKVVFHWATDEISVFVNIVLEIFKICPPNITKLQKAKEEKDSYI